jgi:hypothetical protein
MQDFPNGTIPFSLALTYYFWNKTFGRDNLQQKKKMEKETCAQLLQTQFTHLKELINLKIYPYS